VFGDWNIRKGIKELKRKGIKKGSDQQCPVRKFTGILPSYYYFIFFVIIIIKVIK